MEECGMPSPLPPLYKGAGLGLSRPTRPIQALEAQGIRTDPLPQPATARFPASTARHLHEGRVASVQGRKDEATVPRPVIRGA